VVADLSDLRFDSALLSKPAPVGLAVETTLEHMATVTYWVEPSKLRAHVDSRFELDCIEGPDDRPRALVSVVTFLDRDFRFVASPWFKRSFGQTNYRAYVRDTKTGEHVAWFFGTCLDSASVVVPRYAWKLPWHRGRMSFDCQYDQTQHRYVRYGVSTRSRWAPADLELEDSGTAVSKLDGFSNLEAGLLLLTHPLRGYFFRRDGALGSYAVWHDRLSPTMATLKVARYPLLERLDLIDAGDRRAVHSAFIQHAVAFTIYLPPVMVP
jgi:hypothetical protein